MSATATISRCTFEDNEVSTIGTVYVGQYVVGATMLETLAIVMISDSSFSRNTASFGGSAIAASRGRLELLNSEVNDTQIGEL